MLASALNFAIGFFGYPFEGQYEQSITIEGVGVRDCLSDLTPDPSLSTVLVQQHPCALQHVRCC
jgi:hypothetical protein